MNTKQRKKLVETLQNLVNAQQELIVIYEPLLDAVDSADHAIATIIDPFDGNVMGKDLQDLRALHYDREDQLMQEISSLFDKLEGKDLKPSEESPALPKE